MAKQTFKEIRALYPFDFLILLDFDETTLPDGKIDVVAAEEVRAFQSGEKMLEAYMHLKKSGKKVLFCTPEYKDRLVIDHIPAMRMFR